MFSKSHPSRNIRSNSLTIRLYSRKGFTLIELLVGMGIFGVIFAMTTFSYIQTTKRADLKTETASLIQTLRQAQAEAMTLRVDSLGKLTPFGVHFETQSYTLFRGGLYNPTDPRNFKTELPSTLSLTFNLPADQNVIFMPLEGKVFNFSPTKNQIQVKESATGRIYTLTFNQLGVIDRN